MSMPDRIYKKADFCCGAGGMLHGFELACAERMGVRARFQTVFAVDSWATAAESCYRMTGFRPTVADLFTRDQYIAFHGPRACWCGSKRTLSDCHQAPPPDWRELEPADLRRMCPGGADIIEASPPCTANSNLLPAASAATDPYQALNGLLWRWAWLWLEAFTDNPARLIIMENVPGVADDKRKKRRRGESEIERLEAMLAAYGYATRRTAYDVGEIIGEFTNGAGRKVRGGPSHRPRFLLVARHVGRCQAPLLEPFTGPLSTIAEAIGDLPLPIGDTRIPMHQLPRLARRTEERLAFVTPNGDWRSIEPNWKSSTSFGFQAAGVCDVLMPTAGATDPRLDVAAFGDVLGVLTADKPAGTITGGASPTRGAFSVADHGLDPRLTCTPNGPTLRTITVDRPAPTVTGTEGVWSSASLQVADPIPGTKTLRNGFFGVQRWEGPSATIHGSMDVHCGPSAVEDVRGEPQAGRIIIAPDWALWHSKRQWRPSHWARSFTLREFADLMTVPRLGHDGQPLQFAGTLEEQRKQIGNMVPPQGARVMGELFLATLLSTDLGVSVSGGGGIWVRDGGVLRWYATSRRDGRPSAMEATL